MLTFHMTETTVKTTMQCYCHPNICYTRNHIHTILSPLNMCKVKKEGDVLYDDLNPYNAPAWEEDKLYQQIKQSGIRRIAKESIE